MLSVRNLTKIYKISKKEGKQVIALNNVSIDFPETGLVFLLGKSGSGKSTLLNTIGGLDKFDSGEVIIKGKSSKQFKQSDFDSYRNTFIGFIFQEYNILEEFSVGKNLALALELQGKKAGKAQVDALLDQVDLHGYYKRKPNQLSGGQKQRVAIARALIKDPEIIMADEPTGALDSNTGKQVMETLKKLSKTKLVIIVSHDREFAEIYGDRVVELKDGQVISDLTKTEIEAQKSATGVSFIDDKIIHIKKGQKLSREDILAINKLIIQNTEKEDTLISFDKKPNDELKKTAFITDEGNREIFRNTTYQDIQLKNYDPKNFKLIRSRLKTKDAFKMGASSLKHKPIRLIFTILLSFIAFAMFGVADTIASYNRAISVYESMQMLGNKSIAFTKQVNEGDYYNAQRGITEEDYQNVSNSHKNYDFYKVIGSGQNYNIKIDGEYPEYKSSSNPLNVSFIGGLLPYSSENLSNLKIELIGSAPTNNNEIVISKAIFNSMKNVYEAITSTEDIQTKNITISLDKEYKIVGIADAKTDLSKYSIDSMSSNNLSSWLIQSEIETIMTYGTTNLCFITDGCYNDILSKYSTGTGNRSWDYNYCIAYSENSSTNISFNSIQTVANKIEYFENSYDYQNYFNYILDGVQYENQFIREEEIPAGATNIEHSNKLFKYLKSGVDPNHLSNNQIILSSNIASQIIGEDSDIQAQLNNGYTLKLYETYKQKKYKEFELVGIYNSWDYGILVNSVTRNNLCGKYDYLLTTSKGSLDKDLIINLMKTDSNSYNYKIQFQATSNLDSFASMIESMSKVFLYVGIGLAVFAGFMLLNFIATSINYKKHEIGILRAIGAGKKDVFRIFFSESFVIAIINFVLATIATFLICFFINRSLYVNLGFNITLLSFGVRQILLLLGVSVGVAFISTFLPVWKIARKNPIDSINNR